MNVNNVPVLLKPLFWVYGYGLGFIFYLVGFILHWVCFIRFQGKEHIENLPHYILCFWHNSLPAYFTVFLKHEKKHIWINHPKWYMKPIHVWLWCLGIKNLALGSSGHSGKKGALEVVECLKKGWCSSINPDGPGGPAKVLKKGVLHMAQQSGAPIVPLHIETSFSLSLPTWDKKRVPLPLSTITVKYGEPIIIGEDEDLEKSQKKLNNALMLLEM